MISHQNFVDFNYDDKAINLTHKNHDLMKHQVFIEKPAVILWIRVCILTLSPMTSFIELTFDDSLCIPLVGVTSFLLICINVN